MSEKKLIYLASPYSHENPNIQFRRFTQACSASAQLMKEGHYVFSPIAASHPLTHYGLPGDWEYWEAFDRLMIERCDELVVLQLDGWSTSIGVQAEIDIANELGLPVRFMTLGGEWEADTA